MLESAIVTRAYMESRMVVAMAGRCAERLVLGEANVSTAGASDLEQARQPHFLRDGGGEGRGVGIGGARGATCWLIGWTRALLTWQRPSRLALTGQQHCTRDGVPLWFQSASRTRSPDGQRGGVHQPVRRLGLGGLYGRAQRSGGSQQACRPLATDVPPLFPAPPPDVWPTSRPSWPSWRMLTWRRRGGRRQAAGGMLCIGGCCVHTTVVAHVSLLILCG